MVKVKIGSQDVPPLGYMTDIAFFGEGLVGDERPHIFIPRITRIAFRNDNHRGGSYRLRCKAFFMDGRLFVFDGRQVCLGGGAARK
jgi:hypothetical protein